MPQSAVIPALSVTAVLGWQGRNPGVVDFVILLTLRLVRSGV
jgi:hypothetical protein